MLTVNWVKSIQNQWLSFEKVDLSNVSADGVYII